MRLPESTIRAAILHTEEEVRLAAVSYFSGSFSQDEAIMPLVIEAVERYGRDTAFRILRSAENLPQTEAALDWLIGELQRRYDLADLDEDNYRFAIALVLYRAGLTAVLLQRRGLIIALPMFPQQLRGPLDQRLDMLSWDWERGWAALEELGQHTMRKSGFAWADVHSASHIIESLARNRATGTAFVLGLLQRQYEGENATLMEWLQPSLVKLAGTMKLATAIPVLISYLPDKNLSLADESITALIKIDTDAVVSAITEGWGNAGTGFRVAAADVLEHIHTDLSTEVCLKFFNAEVDRETKLCLAHAVLSQFVEEGVEQVRQLVLGPDQGLLPDSLDLRYRLVAVCTVMGVSFPEIGDWHQDARANHWGLGDYRPPRLADSFRSNGPGPKRSGNGKAHSWLN